MDPRIVPPEEKLLRLIRGKQKTPASGSQPGPPPGASGVGGQSRVGWKLPAWWLTAINIGLGCLVVGEVTALLRLAMKPTPMVTAQIPQPQTATSQAGQPQPASSVPPEPITPSADSAKGKTAVADSIPSLASAASRPMFQTPSSQSPTPRQTTPAPSAQAKTLAARLSLIGIVAGNPAQAIIEDSQTKKTHFVTVGQGVIEGLIVEDVREDRVVLDLNGEKIELSL